MNNEDNIIEDNSSRREILLNGKPLKVTDEQQATFSSHFLKKAALGALIFLAVATPVAARYVSKGLGATELSSEIEAQQTVNTITEEAIDNTETRTDLEKTPKPAPTDIIMGAKEEKVDVSSIKVDDITLEVADPEIVVEGDEVTYIIPYGFTYDGNNCYRLLCEGEEPEGYVKDADGITLYQVDADMQYQVKEGSILVGDKAVDVYDVEDLKNNGIDRNLFLGGYEIRGNKCFSITDAIPLTDENGNLIDIYDETEPIAIYHDDGTYSYGAPEGYIYINDTCYKIDVPEQTMGR